MKEVKILLVTAMNIKMGFLSLLFLTGLWAVAANPEAIKKEENKYFEWQTVQSSTIVVTITPPTVIHHGTQLNATVVVEATKVTKPAKVTVVVEAPKVTEPAKVTVVMETPKVTKPTIEEAPKVSEPAVEEAPKVTEPAVEEAPKVTEPAVEEAPKVTEPAVDKAAMVAKELLLSVVFIFSLFIIMFM